MSVISFLVSQENYIIWTRYWDTPLNSGVSLTLPQKEWVMSLHSEPDYLSNLNDPNDINDTDMIKRSS